MSEAFKPTVSCVVCSVPSLRGSNLCERCRRLRNRLDIRKDADGRSRRPDKAARLAAMKDQWDPEAGAFRCYYSDVELTDDYPSHRFASWEHLTPGDETSVVLVADLINKMKTDLTEKEFGAMIRALYRRLEGQPFDASAFPDRPSNE